MNWEEIGLSEMGRVVAFCSFLLICLLFKDCLFGCHQVTWMPKYQFLQFKTPLHLCSLRPPTLLHTHTKIFSLSLKTSNLQFSFSFFIWSSRKIRLSFFCFYYNELKFFSHTPNWSWWWWSQYWSTQPHFRPEFFIFSLIMSYFLQFISRSYDGMLRWSSSSPIIPASAQNGTYT